MTASVREETFVRKGLMCTVGRNLKCSEKDSMLVNTADTRTKVTFAGLHCGKTILLYILLIISIPIIIPPIVLYPYVLQ